MQGGSNGGFTAVAGYDLVTGWGSPQCGLVSRLGQPPVLKFIVDGQFLDGSDAICGPRQLSLRNVTLNGVSFPTRDLPAAPT